MKVLLAVPPGIDKLELYKILGLKAPPLGLAWIAAVLERAGHKVRIIDSPTEGIDLKAFMGEVKSWQPDIVGITAITPTIYKAYEAAKAIKEYDKDIPIIMGGPHVTFMYEEALSNNVDVVVRGEGEYTTLELINTVEKYGLDPARLKSIRGLHLEMVRMSLRRQTGHQLGTLMNCHHPPATCCPWIGTHCLVSRLG